jgi:hypothetical protein
VDIVGGETIRADDGLALSSRNAYLSARERAEAPRLYRLLQRISAEVRAGERDFTRLEREATDELDRNGWKTDYVAVRRQSDLQVPEDVVEQSLVVLAASRLGAARRSTTSKLSLQALTGCHSTTFASPNSKPVKIHAENHVEVEAAPRQRHARRASLRRVMRDRRGSPRCGKHP